MTLLTIPLWISTWDICWFWNIHQYQGRPKCKNFVVSSWETSKPFPLPIFLSCLDHTMSTNKQGHKPGCILTWQGTCSMCLLLHKTELFSWILLLSPVSRCPQHSSQELSAASRVVPMPEIPLQKGKLPFHTPEIIFSTDPQLAQVNVTAGFFLSPL